MAVQVRGGSYQIPQGICVACGGSGPAAGVLKKGFATAHTNLSLSFPVCENCEAIRARVKAAQVRNGGKALLAAIPLTIAIAALYVVTTGDAPGNDFMHDSAWWHLVLLSVPAFLVTYGVALWVLDHVVSPGGAPEPSDIAIARGIESSVKIRAVQEARGILSAGQTTFTFTNPAYRQAFWLANLGNVLT